MCAWLSVAALGGTGVVVCGVGFGAARARTPEALPTHRSVLLTQHSAVTTWSRSRWTNKLPLPASASQVRMGPVLSAV